MQKLKAAIARQDLLGASLIVAGRFCENMSQPRYIAQVEALTETVKLHLDPNQSEEACFRQFVKAFYTHLAFSSNEQDYFSSRYSLLNEVIDYRTGIPVTLSILFCHIANKLGFMVHGVNFPGHFLIRYQVSESRALFLDPLNGKFLSWHELETLYFSILSDAEEEEMPIEAIKAADAQEVVVRLLQNLKAAFIKEEKYQQALATVELLVDIVPDDPYERRDRGFLLHQLECPQLAMPDYKYFIAHCPQDPGAQLLKLQIRRYHSQDRLVKH